MKQRFEDKKVTYSLETEHGLVLVENVPARVCAETGDRFFSPEVVERLQQIVWGREKPVRTVEAPVFEFAE